MLILLLLLTELNLSRVQVSHSTVYAFAISIVIVIENPTAESIAALRDVPAEELSRLKQVLLGGSREETPEEEEAQLRRMAAHSAARFDEEGA